MVAYQRTPGPAEAYQRHACHAGLGAAVLTLDGKQGRRVEARELWLGRGMPFLQHALSLMELGGGRWGLHSRFHDVSQGQETRRETVFVEHRGGLQVALDEGFTEKPGPGSCGEAASAQSSTLSRHDVDARGAPQLDLVLRYNLGPSAVLRAQTVRSGFVLRDGVFIGR